MANLAAMNNWMKMGAICGWMCVAAVTVSAAEAAAKDAAKESAAKEVAVIETTKGQMVLEFWPDVAPGTVENFKKLAKQKFFDGTAFHRIVKGFMIQGGDPFTKDPAQEARHGYGNPGYTIKAEFNPRKHQPGVISMARGRDPDSAGSQFFICLANRPDLDGKYTTFGRLVKGMDVLEAIGNTPVTRSRSGELSKPTVRVGVKSIRIVSADAVQ